MWDGLILEASLAPGYWEAYGQVLWEGLRTWGEAGRQERETFPLLLVTWAQVGEDVSAPTDWWQLLNSPGAGPRGHYVLQRPCLIIKGLLTFPFPGQRNQYFGQVGHNDNFRCSDSTHFHCPLGLPCPLWPVQGEGVGWNLLPGVLSLSFFLWGQRLENTEVITNGT